MSSTLIPLITELRHQIDTKVDDLRQDSRMAELLSLHTALNALEKSAGG